MKRAGLAQADEAQVLRVIWPFTGSTPFYVSGRFWMGVAAGFVGGWLVSKIT